MKAREQHPNVNFMCAEQTFARLSRYHRILCSMPKTHHLFYIVAGQTPHAECDFVLRVSQIVHSRKGPFHSQLQFLNTYSMHFLTGKIYWYIHSTMPTDTYTHTDNAYTDIYTTRQEYVLLSYKVIIRSISTHVMHTLTTTKLMHTPTKLMRTPTELMRTLKQLQQSLAFSHIYT